MRQRRTTTNLRRGEWRGRSTQNAAVATEEYCKQSLTRPRSGVSATSRFRDREPLKSSEWELRDASSPQGQADFEQKGVEFPQF